MVKQYEIYMLNLDPTIGSEMNKVRPCVVLSPNEKPFPPASPNKKRVTIPNIRNITNHKTYSLNPINLFFIFISPLITMVLHLINQ